MTSELGQISFYLAKKEHDFFSVIEDEKLQEESDNFKIREFQVNDVKIKFFCMQSSVSNKDNPPWLDFVNEQLSSDEDKIYFETFSRRPSGLL